MNYIKQIDNDFNARMNSPHAKEEMRLWVLGRRRLNEEKRAIKARYWRPRPKKLTKGQKIAIWKAERGSKKMDQEFKNVVGL